MGRAARQRALFAAMPAALAALCVLLVSGAFVLPEKARTAHLVAWAFLAQVGAAAGARRLSREGAVPRWAAEEGLLLVIAALALAQVSAGALAPLLYLLAAAFVLAHPLPMAVGLIAFALALDAALLGPRWGILAAHAGFTALFASLYHALLAFRLRAVARVQRRAVARRLAEAERSAREFRLVATASGAPGRGTLASVAEVEGSIRDALQIAATALSTHTAALFLASSDGEALRLRDCASASERLFRGPLPAREGALGAVMASGRAVRLEASSLTYYDGGQPSLSFLGVPLRERDGVLATDRSTPFSEAEERLLGQIASQIARALEAERVLSQVRREKDEKARFFHALEELNRTSTVAQAAQAAVEQARALCPALDLCALTVVDGAAGDESKAGRVRHRVEAAEGDGADVLRGLGFADNAGLVANVVRLGSPLPARPPGAMERLLIFDGGTVLRGIACLKIFPLRSGEESAGALVCASRNPGALPDTAQRELALLAEQAAGALLRARLHDRAERLATTDGLTGLLNRRTLTSQLEARVREARRYGRKVSLVLLDVDHFKRVNDTHGHPAGDAVLRGVAALVKAQARATDLAARYGGEEMALVLPETDGPGALAIAERLRAAVAAAAHQTAKGTVRVTVSLGVATAPDDADDASALIEAADAALYRAKQAGRDRVERARCRAAA